MHVSQNQNNGNIKLPCKSRLECARKKKKVNSHELKGGSISYNSSCSWLQSEDHFGKETKDELHEKNQEKKSLGSLP